MINATKEDNKVLDDLLGWLQSMGYSFEIVPTEDFRVHTYVIMNLENRKQFSFRMMEVNAVDINKNLYAIFAAMDGLGLNQIYNGLVQMNTCDLAARIYSRFSISLAEKIQKEIGYER